MKKYSFHRVLRPLKISLLLAAVLVVTMLNSVYADANKDYSVTPQPYTGYKTVEGSKKGLVVGAAFQAVNYQCDSLMFNLDITNLVTTKNTGMLLYSVNGKKYYFDDSLVSAIRASILDYKASYGGQLAVIKMYSFSVIPGLTWQSKPAGTACVSLDAENYEENIKKLFGYLGQYLGKCTDYWILGNEIDAADTYNYMGGIANCSIDKYGRLYACLMKDLYNVMVCYNGNTSLLISFDQGWNFSTSDHYSTKQLISVIQKKLRELGDFCWGLAPQCYNVEHVDTAQHYATPIWWNDKTKWPNLVTNDYDTPMIVVDNIDVLIRYMYQDSMLYNGKIRPILIGEIGFSEHNNGAEDEDSQVLAFERFHQKVMDTPELIAYMYNNQADGGGVWFNMDGHKLQKVFTDTGDSTDYSLLISSSVIYGDINGDSKYSAIDLAYMTSHILGKNTLSGDQYEAADISGDGKISAVDLAYLTSYLLGKIDAIPQR